MCFDGGGRSRRHPVGEAVSEPTAAAVAWPDPMARPRPSAPPAAAVLIFSITVTGILANTLVGPGHPRHPRRLRPARLPAPGSSWPPGTLPGIVMAPVIGVLADRFGRRAVLVPCLVVFGVVRAARRRSPRRSRRCLLCRLLPGHRLGRPHQPRGRPHRRPLGRARAGPARRPERRRPHRVPGRVPARSAGCSPSSAAGGCRSLPYALGLATAVLIYRRLDASRPARPRHAARAAAGRPAAAVRHRDVVGSIIIGFVVFMLIFGLFLTAMPVHLEREFGLAPASGAW